MAAPMIRHRAFGIGCSSGAGSPGGSPRLNTPLYGCADDPAQRPMFNQLIE
jgi:hypothetical protein